MHCGGCWRTCPAFAAVHGTNGWGGPCRRIRGSTPACCATAGTSGRACGSSLAAGAGMTSATWPSPVRLHRGSLHGCADRAFGCGGSSARALYRALRPDGAWTAYSCWSCQRRIIHVGTGVHAAQRATRPASSRAGRTRSASSGGSLMASSLTPTRSSMKTCGAGCTDPAGRSPAPPRLGGQGAVPSLKCRRQPERTPVRPNNNLLRSENEV